MDRLIPKVDVEPPSVDPGAFDFGAFVDNITGWIGAHPVPVVLGIAAIILTKWLTKPFMKGIILGLVVAAIVFYAMGG